MHKEGMYLNNNLLFNATRGEITSFKLGHKCTCDLDILYTKILKFSSMCEDPMGE
jgi:hypothetical protein